MIQIIVHAFVEDGQGAVVEVLYASTNEEAVKDKLEQYKAQFPNDYVVAYDLPLDTELEKLSHYPSVWIGKEEFLDD